MKGFLGKLFGQEPRQMPLADLARQRLRELAQ
jgi:hypothetical protein